MKPSKIRLTVSCIIAFSVLYLNNVAGNLYINEILASNTAYYAGNSEYTDWIEIYNSSSSTVNLGSYFLTDNKATPYKWFIPAGTTIAANEYKIFYADELNTGQHTNFRLSVDGEYIGLYNTAGVLVDSFTYKRQRNNISFGRSASNPVLKGYFQTPSPAASNGNISYASMLEKPVFSAKGGFHNSSQTLTIAASAGASVYYTTNGAEPTTSSTLYTSAIAIDSTKCVRAVAIMSGLLKSDVSTQTYFINVSKTLPVVSLVTDPDNLFSNTTGIYIIGTNGRADGCSSTPMNLNQDWERPVNIELYDENGIIKINQGAGVKIFGGCSRQRFPIKSLELFARKQYGKGSFEAQLFKSKDIMEFESFLLRGASDDQQKTMFRDALGHTLVSDLKAESQAYQPAVLYINGQYWGIHNIREKYSEDYFTKNFGVSEDNLNLVENNPNNSWSVKNGSASDYLNMLAYLRSNATRTDIYETMNTRMDIESYIDYMASQIYLCPDDWPGNNIRYWKANTGRYNRWRWVYYDMDHVVSHNNSMWNSILLATTPYYGNDWPNPPWSVELFNNLLKGNKFKYEFLQRICFFMNSVLSAERILHVVDSLRSNIAAEMPYHIQRWGGKLVDDPLRASWIKPLPKSMTEWENYVQVMRKFAIDRPDTAINMLRRFFKLSDTVRITLSSNNPELGYLFMGPKCISTPFHEGVYFSNIPLVINAKPKPGYRFVRWEVTPYGASPDVFTTSEISYTPAKNTHFKAVFEPYTIEGPVVVINEINYHSKFNANTGDWVELYNRVPDAVDISGWILKDEKDNHSFEIPENTILPVDGYYVINEDTTLFQRLFPKVRNRIGNFNFGFDNNSDCVGLYDAYMTFVDSVRYTDQSPWPSQADGQGRSLALISPTLFNDLPKNWSDLYMLTPGDTNIMKSEDPNLILDPLAETATGNWLNQNYPNPCAGNTTICYGLGTSGKVSLLIYDLLGRAIKTVVSEYQIPDSYELTVNTEEMAPGTYLYSLRIDNKLIKTRIMIVK